MALFGTFGFQELLLILIIVVFLFGAKKIPERKPRKEGERPLWLNLSMIGSLGWLVMIPTLIGVFAGRWLDHRFESGIFFSGALIFAGICVGSYLAWNRMNRE